MSITYKSILKAMFKDTIEAQLMLLDAEDQVKVKKFVVLVRNNFNTVCGEIMHLYQDILGVVDDRIDYLAEVNQLDNKYREFMYRLWDLSGNETKLKEYMTMRIENSFVSDASFKRIHWLIGNAVMEDITLAAYKEFDKAI